MIKIFKITCCIFLLFGTVSNGHEYSINTLRIEHPIIPIFGDTMKTAAGYMLIENNGKASDKLLGIKAEFAKATIHETSIDENGVVRMIPLEFVTIPSGESVKFEHGGLHIMFFDLQEKLEHLGDKEVLLNFEKAGDFRLIFMVEEMDGYSNMAMDHNKDH